MHYNLWARENLAVVLEAGQQGVQAQEDWYTTEKSLNSSTMSHETPLLGPYVSL